MSTTATITATATSSSVSATSTDSGGGSNGSGQASNSLYLFTFLTTLLLLLAVSCGIVLRSFILRRRFRRRVEAAIAAGVLLPEQVEALRRRAPPICERPMLWEVRIGKGGPGFDANGKKLGSDDGMETKEINDVNDNDNDDEDDDWANVMPVSATIIPASKKDKFPTQTSLAQSAEVRSEPSRRLWQRRNPTSSSVSPVSVPPPTTTPPADALLAPSPGNVPPAEPLDKLQLTVLIAMPNANAPRYKPSGSSTNLPESDISEVKGKRLSVDSYDDDEEEIPEVVFGLTEVLWEAGTDWRPNMNPNPTGENQPEDTRVNRNVAPTQPPTA